MLNISVVDEKIVPRIANVIPLSPWASPPMPSPNATNEVKRKNKIKQPMIAATSDSSSTPPYVVISIKPPITWIEKTASAEIRAKTNEASPRPDCFRCSNAVLLDSLPFSDRLRRISFLVKSKMGCGHGQGRQGGVEVPVSVPLKSSSTSVFSGCCSAITRHVSLSPVRAHTFHPPSVYQECLRSAMPA